MSLSLVDTIKIVINTVVRLIPLGLYTEFSGSLIKLLDIEEMEAIIPV